MADITIEEIKKTINLETLENFTEIQSNFDWKNAWTHESLSEAILQLKNIGRELKKKRLTFNTTNLQRYFKSSDPAEEQAYLTLLATALTSLDKETLSPEQIESVRIPPWLKVIDALFRGILIAAIAFDIFTLLTNIPASPFLLTTSFFSLLVTVAVLSTIALGALALTYYFYRSASTKEQCTLYQLRCTQKECDLIHALYETTHKINKSESNLLSPRPQNLAANSSESLWNSLTKTKLMKILSRLGEGFSMSMSTLFWNFCSIGAMLGFPFLNMAMASSAVFFTMLAIAIIVAITMVAYSFYASYKKSLTKENFSAIEKKTRHYKTELGSIIKKITSCPNFNDIPKGYSSPILNHVSTNPNPTSASMTATVINLRKSDTPSIRTIADINLPPMYTPP